MGYGSAAYMGYGSAAYMGFNRSSPELAISHDNIEWTEGHMHSNENIFNTQ